MDAPTIEGDGVVLRAIREDDAEAWLAGEDEDALVAFEAPRPARLDDVERAIARWRASWADEGSLRQWAIVAQPEGDLAGGVDLRDLGGWREANLAYVVFPPFRGRGLATAASRAAVRYAAEHLGVRSVRIAVLTDNVRSLHVARRLGASHVGREPSDRGATFEVFRLELE